MSEIKVNKISPKTNCGTVTVGDSGDSVSVTTGVPVTVNGDLKSNALKATDGGVIISQSGTNITIGASGDTVSLASGASQSGFGRSGSVNWQTSVKTVGFTAVSGEGYFCNTTSAAFTVTLPATPSAGDIVALKDYALTFDTNNLTIGRNSQPIEGQAQDAVISVEGQSVTLVYIDGTQGWKITDQGKKADVVFPQYIVATGGTISCCGNFKIHKFTSPGTFTVCSVGNPAGSDTVDYMVVAGGGGASPSPSSDFAGGGGGGGWRASSGTASGCYTAGPAPLTSCVAALPVCAQGYPITVGGGGSVPKGSGSNSVFSTITSAGGGGGGFGTTSTTNDPGGNGGSGGGGSRPATNSGSGNTPPVSPPQGNPGGTGPGGAGGGGAAGAGLTGGNSGSGVDSSISASPVFYAAGGKGGGQRFSPPFAPGPNGRTGIGNAGAVNTGAGGAGGAEPPAPTTTGTAGGSGIVIIRYRFQ